MLEACILPKSGIKIPPSRSRQTPSGGHQAGTTIWRDARSIDPPSIRSASPLPFVNFKNFLIDPWWESHAIQIHMTSSALESNQKRLISHSFHGPGCNVIHTHSLIVWIPFEAKRRSRQYLQNKSWKSSLYIQGRMVNHLGITFTWIQLEASRCR